MFAETLEESDTLVSHIWFSLNHVCKESLYYEMNCMYTWLASMLLWEMPVAFSWSSAGLSCWSASTIRDEYSGGSRFRAFTVSCYSCLSAHAFRDSRLSVLTVLVTVTLLKLLIASTLSGTLVFSCFSLFSVTITFFLLPTLSGYSRFSQQNVHCKAFQAAFQSQRLASVFGWFAACCVQFHNKGLSLSRNSV